MCSSWNELAVLFSPLLGSAAAVQLQCLILTHPFVLGPVTKDPGQSMSTGCFFN